MIDEPWPIRGLAVGAHKDTRELRHKHRQPTALKLPAVHGERARGDEDEPPVSSWGGSRFGMLHRLKIP